MLVTSRITSISDIPGGIGTPSVLTGPVCREEFLHAVNPQFTQHPLVRHGSRSVQCDDDIYSNGGRAANHRIVRRLSSSRETNAGIDSTSLISFLLSTAIFIRMLSS